MSGLPAAVVLAAGLGSRLGGIPKALFELDGVPLLGRCASRLAEAGFTRMAVVTGHAADSVERWWRAGPRPLAAEFLHNPRFAELNNFHTLELACELLPPGRLLALNADIVFTTGVVVDAVSTGGELTLAVERGRVDSEALGVRIEHGAVRELGKHLDAGSSFGEFIGISLLDDRGRHSYRRAAHAARAAGEVDLYYEDIYSRICGALDARVAEVPSGHWAEIDTPDDVPSALAVVRSGSP